MSGFDRFVRRPVAARMVAAGLALICVLGLRADRPSVIEWMLGGSVERTTQSVDRGRSAARSSERPDADLSGLARVVDGDTINVAGRRVRLEGIDAPELAQVCKGGDAKRWRAGHAARRKLDRLIAGQRVTCRAHGNDDYGRVLATCFAGKTNLNAAMVRQGYAWAFVKYAQTYTRQELAARRSRLGVWQSDCQTAWAFRAGRWTDQAADAPSGCPIKGNISRNGRIYHTPWSPWYGRTRVSPERGERWFCSEADALAAGWRRPAAS